MVAKAIAYQISIKVLLPARNNTWLYLIHKLIMLDFFRCLDIKIQIYWKCKSTSSVTI